MSLLLLLGCGNTFFGKDPSGDDTGPLDSGPVTKTDAVADADADADSDADTDTDPTTGAALEELLAALRADRDDALQELNLSHGFPVAVDGGWLFVCTFGPDYGLAGDMNGWSSEPMNQEDDFSWLVRSASAGDGYKYTDGRAWEPDPWSRAYRYDEYGEMSNVPDPSVAHLERLFGVGGATASARTLHLWVPPSHTHTLYAHDGQNLFDPEAFWGGWRLDESVPDQMLVVGLDNTADRMDEYTHTEDYVYSTWYGGGADDYLTYLRDDVRPLVEDVYGAEGTVGILGSSLGGLVSLYAALAQPEDYTFAASLSGTVGWGSIGADNPTLIDLYTGAGHGGTALYLDSGGGGTCVDSDGDGIEDDARDGSDNYCENLQLRDVLESEGYRFDEDLWHWWEPGAEHNEAAWAERVGMPLSVFAGL